ncbi:hypothetical protein HHL19_11065 [Streptomyces sp. R302]|uniref:hypothetical protein n=1 Tax=unclassified Streptomyces TaxID=2593676 RepID=UPI00145E4E12|nr:MULTISPECIES: hypothetical protein [unclassified Streptomyces]NML50202.1 hypothetical protein [Streptomyces sp. R301]NML79193.1 hypothetical protein [Streptomyces sp. R302]
MIRTRLALAAAVATLALAAPAAALAADLTAGPATPHVSAAALPGDGSVIDTTDDMIWQ